MVMVYLFEEQRGKVGCGHGISGDSINLAAASVDDGLLE